MADIVRFPAGCEILTFEGRPRRGGRELTSECWATLVPFAKESAESDRPLRFLAEAVPPEPPAS